MSVELLAMVARHAAKTHAIWHDATFVHPMALVALFGLGIWHLLAPRRTALLPLLLLVCCIPSAQRIVLAGADFTLLRLMVLVGLTRVIARGELSTIRPQRIDLCYSLWVLIGSLVYVLQRGDAAAAMYVLGTSMDMLGAYAVTRALVRTAEDLRSLVRGMAIIAVPVAIAFACELATQRNPFAFFGGVPELTAVREDRLRCQGAFAHPILAGVFWASVFALLTGGTVCRQRPPWTRWLFGLGAACSLFVVFASASSTPVLGIAAAFLFWLCWPVRHLMRHVFLAAPFLLLVVHFMMEAPVWHLVSRMSAVGGSTGYHRFVLIDGAIRHLNEWWLVGTSWTGHWSEHFQTWDITNQYIFEGVRGGIWRLGLFCILIYLVARSIATAQGRAQTKADRFLLWGLGASLFVHCVCFIGVSYFGQIQYLWYMTLAIGASAYAPEFFATTTTQQPAEVARRLSTADRTRRGGMPRIAREAL